MTWQDRLNPHSRLRIDAHTEFGVRVGDTVYAYDTYDAAQSDVDRSNNTIHLVTRTVGAWKTA